MIYDWDGKRHYGYYKTFTRLCKRNSIMSIANSDNIWCRYTLVFLNLLRLAQIANVFEDLHDIGSQKSNLRDYLSFFVFVRLDWKQDIEFIVYFVEEFTF